MAQDESYQTTVYEELGGNRKVIGSGGTMAIESGGSAFVANSGTFTLASGMDLSVLAGASIGFGGVGFSAAELVTLIVSNQLLISDLPLGAATTLTASNLPKNVKVYMIAASATLVSASFWLTSVSAGRDVWLGVVGDSAGTHTNQLTQVDVSMSGCICIGSDGAELSRFEMNCSIASDCLVHLISPDDDVWAVVSTRGDVDERGEL